MTPSPSIEEMTKALEGVTPIAHLVWRNALIAADDAVDYYEVARPGDKSVDGSDPFPVYAACSPDRMRAFLDQYRTLEGEVERLRAENEAQFVVMSTEITDQDGFNVEQRVAWKDILLPRAEAAEARVAELEAESFQARVSAAHHALFHDDPTDVAERCARYFEESGETCQAFGMTEDEAIALVRYTWSRPAGEPKKEIGAAALTLASLCVTAGYDMMACAEADLEKLQHPETIARIRAKRATRHGRGPLPGFDPALTKGGSNGR